MALLEPGTVSGKERLHYINTNGSMHCPCSSKDHSVHGTRILGTVLYELEERPQCTRLTYSWTLYSLEETCTWLNGSLLPYCPAAEERLQCT